MALPADRLNWRPGEPKLNCPFLDGVPFLGHHWHWESSVIGASVIQFSIAFCKSLWSYGSDSLTIHLLFTSLRFLVAELPSLSLIGACTTMRRPSELLELFDVEWALVDDLVRFFDPVVDNEIAKASQLRKISTSRRAWVSAQVSDMGK